MERTNGNKGIQGTTGTKAAATQQSWLSFVPSLSWSPGTKFEAIRAAMYLVISLIYGLGLTAKNLFVLRAYRSKVGNIRAIFGANTDTAAAKKHNKKKFHNLASLITMDTKTGVVAISWNPFFVTEYWARAILTAFVQVMLDKGLKSQTFLESANCDSQQYALIAEFKKGNYVACDATGKRTELPKAPQQQLATPPVQGPQQQTQASA